MTKAAYPSGIRYPGHKTVHARHPTRRVPLCKVTATRWGPGTAAEHLVLTTAPVTCGRPQCRAVADAQRDRS